MGYAFCLDIKSGKKIWLRDLVKEEKCTFPIWGFSASPDMLGGNVLYHVGGQASGNILSLDIITGKTKWAVGKDKKAGSYASPLLIESKGEKQLICWGPNKITGLPDRWRRGILEHPLRSEVRCIHCQTDLRRGHCVGLWVLEWISCHRIIKRWKIRQVALV